MNIALTINNIILRYGNTCEFIFTTYCLETKLTHTYKESPLWPPNLLDICHNWNLLSVCRWWVPLSPIPSEHLGQKPSLLPSGPPSTNKQPLYFSSDVFPDICIKLTSSFFIVYSWVLLKLGGDSLWDAIFVNIFNSKPHEEEAHLAEA